VRPGIPASWRGHWDQRGGRTEIIATLLAVTATLALLTKFLERMEERAGVALPDPLLSLFPARDVTWLIFGCIYIGLIAAIALLAGRPRSLLVALQVYTVMVLFRICAMYLLPLDPPAGMIPLRDPFVEFFGTGSVLTKDLFFSGHTATLFLLALTLPGRTSRRVYVALTAMVAAGVILQHVHYTVDVFVAPFVAYGSYRLVRGLHGVVHGEWKPGSSAMGDN
jgi:hypothetical protein